MHAANPKLNEGLLPDDDLVRIDNDWHGGRCGPFDIHNGKTLLGVARSAADSSAQTLLEPLERRHYVGAESWV
jgi:hypothetical protein